jgi:hypothetical protein
MMNALCWRGCQWGKARTAFAVVCAHVTRLARCVVITVRDTVRDCFDTLPCATCSPIAHDASGFVRGGAAIPQLAIAARHVGYSVKEVAGHNIPNRRALRQHGPV